jgi:hypothetical protein
MIKYKKDLGITKIKKETETPEKINQIKDIINLTI